MHSGFVLISNYRGSEFPHFAHLSAWNEAFAADGDTKRAGVALITRAAVTQLAVILGGCAGGQPRTGPAVTAAPLAAAYDGRTLGRSVAF